MKTFQDLRREPPLRLRPVSGPLELALRPSPRLHMARRLLGCGILLYAVELLVTGHRLAAVLVVLLVAACLRSWPGTVHAGAGRPLSLLLAADGQLLLGYGGGRVEAVCLRPESLALGRYLLLVLRSEGHTVRLLLGPDNLTPGELAALKRRLLSGAPGRLGYTRLQPPSASPPTNP